MVLGESRPFGKVSSTSPCYLENWHPSSLPALTAPWLLFQMDCHAGASGTIYEYGALTIDGEEYIPFKKYAGKYILFVNVASY